MMTNTEIIRDWSEAKYPAKQIDILAQLNAVKPAKIRSIIKENGANVVAEAYANGESLTIISQKYGIAYPIIREMITSVGLEIKNKGHSKRKDIPAPTEGEPVESEIHKNGLEPYLLVKVLAEVVDRLCVGYDVELSRTGNKTSIHIFNDKERLTWISEARTQEDEN